MRLGHSLALGACLIGVSALIAACGGGGGGSGSLPSPGGGGGGGGSSSSPAPTATPGISGTLVVAPSSSPLAANSTVTITCGCSGQAGETTIGAGGTFSAGASLTAIPPSPSPTYTLAPARNYLIVGYQSNSHVEAWTMEFVGNTPATNLNLFGSNSSASNVSDTASTAAALYVYGRATVLESGGTQTFDLFNFNSVLKWAQYLRAGMGLSPAETKFLSDIQIAQAQNVSLFPENALPDWNPLPANYGSNPTITSDINAIASAGPSAGDPVPTPCPAVGQCTGTPTP
jgi:hypothetical protein